MNDVVNETQNVPIADLEKIRVEVIAQFSSLLQLQGRSRILKKNIEKLVKQFFIELIGNLPPETESYHPIADHYYRLVSTLKLLSLQQDQQFNASENYVESVMVEFNEIIGKLMASVHELEFYSTHDPLTGLHNRRYFNEILEYEIARASRHDYPFSIFLIDLDNFKDVNDTYGHLSGDELLQNLAKLLRSYLRKGDILCRIGGDEFAAILTETPLENAKEVGELLRKMISSTIFNDLKGNRYHITVSIGVVNYPNDAKDLMELLSNVDVALYQAKEKGKDEVITFGSLETKAHPERKIKTYVEELRIALEENRIVPYFQPIVSCKDNEIFGYEALARLQKENGEIVTAANFVEVIESHGLSRKFNQAIFTYALKSLKTKMLESERSIKIFLNVSARAVQAQNLLDYVVNLCKELEISTENVVFEILESDAIKDIISMREFILDLRVKGFAFALDDFGSGYNTFHYLHELPIDYVKIEGAFVRNIMNSKIDYALVYNICRLCRDLNITTVAEFVEDGVVFNELKKIGIDYAQGYYVGKPAPV